MAASGNFAYMGTATNGGVLQVVDVTDPAKPVLRGAANVTTINRLQVHGHHVYAADELAGVHVFDVSNPDAPVEVRLWNDGCTDKLGYAAGDIALSADGTLGAIACGTGMHLVDLSQPGNPVRIGGYTIDYWTSRPTVALRGDRAWYADPTGVREFDISTPSAPACRRDQSRSVRAAPVARARVRRLFAFTYQTGMHVFGTAETGDRLFADGFEAAAPTH